MGNLINLGKLPTTVIDNRISMVRGDTFKKILFLNQGTATEPVRYKLQEDDRVFFSVFESNSRFEDGLIKKSFTSCDLNEEGDIKIILEPFHTEKLKDTKYFYMVKLVKADGEVTTVVQETPISVRG